MPNSIEAQGVTVEEAIQVALNQLGVTRDRVEIQILHHPRGGFLGIGARRAKVRATLRETFLADGDEFDMSAGAKVGRGRRGRRGSRRRRGRRGDGKSEDEQSSGRRGEGRDGQRGNADERAPTGGRSERRDRRQDEGRDRTSRGDESRERGGRAERGGRGQDRRRGRNGANERRGEHHSGGQARGGGGRSSERSADSRSQSQSPRTPPTIPPSSPSPSDPTTARTPVAEASVLGMAEVAGAEQSRTESAPPRRHPVRERSDSPTQVIATDTVRERAQAIVTELLERMGFQARVTSDVDTAEGEVVVRVSADAEGLLIGRRGQTVDALEHLINRMISTGEATAESRVAVDIGGYRDRRKEALIELAERLKERAVTQGRRIQVSPMSPRDRRILLGVLSHDDTIRTRVLGTGFYRRVALFPAGLEDESATIEVNDEGEDAFAGRRAGDDESA